MRFYKIVLFSLCFFICGLYVFSEEKCDYNFIKQLIQSGKITKGEYIANKYAYCSASRDMERLQQKIRENNYNFIIDYNREMFQPVEELAGTFLPDQLSNLIRKQNREVQKNEEYKKRKDSFMLGCSPDKAKWDWREKEIVSKVKDQQTCGACWSFAGAAVFESAYMLYNRGQDIDLSEQYILNCSGAGDCIGGFYAQAFSHLIHNSFPLESSIPYLNQKTFCDRPEGSDTGYYTMIFGFVGETAHPKTEDIKRSLCQFGPVASSVKATELLTAYSSGVFDENANVAGPDDVNHAVVIVGWDDEKEAFLVKNSWGEKWGMDGYFWIKYGTNNIGTATIWVLVKPQE